MKTRLMSWKAVAFASCLLIPSLQAESGKSFFMPRAVNSMTYLTEAGSNNFLYENQISNRFALSATAFYQQSRQAKDLGKYFLPGGKSELVIKGATAGGAADISGTWLQLAGINTDAGAFHTGFVNARESELYLNSYQSKIRIRPEYSSYGTILHAQRFIPELSSRLWVSLQWPIVQVESNTSLHEWDRQNSVENRNQLETFNAQNVGGVGARWQDNAEFHHSINAYEALNNPLWKYGKITNHKQKIAGFSDLEGKVGYRLNDSFNVYGKVTLPLSQKAKAEYVFEPLLGNGSHWALGGGVSYDANLDSLLTTNTKMFHYHASLEYHYLFENNQLRTFDLKNNPWSRYLLVVERDKNSRGVLPGVNFLTQKVDCTPRHEVAWNNVVNIAVNNWLDVEAGYNLWYKHKEKINLPHWSEKIHVARRGFGANNAGGGAATPFEIFAAPVNRLIGQHTPEGAGALDLNAAEYIRKDNLEIQAAAHPTTYSHTLFANINIAGSWEKQPFNFSLGGSYEIANANKSLERWGVFGKFSMDV